MIFALWLLLGSITMCVHVDSVPASSIQTSKLSGVSSEVAKSKVNPTIQWKQESSKGLNIRHGKKRRGKHNRKHKQKNRNRFASAKRYFEKQLLVRNRTLALLGDEVEKILQSSTGILGMNSELPGKSPFTSWYTKTLNRTIKGPMLNQSFLVNTNMSSVNLSVVPTELPLSSTMKTGVNSSDKIEDVSEYQYDYETFTLKDDMEQYQLNFQSTLSRLLDVLENSSIERSVDETPCEQWIDCRDSFQQAFLGSLPACPCHYPSGIFYEDKVWDAGHDQHFRWRDASGERLDVYKPGAEYCIRSLLAQGSTTLAAQHCCYDRHRRLITRGSGAGNPNFVSPDVSAVLHDKIDILPWRLCKGDFTQYNRVRPPNNDNNCEPNPKDEEFNKQVQAVKFF